MASIDPIMQKVLEAVPFRLTPEGGPEAARTAFRDLPRRPLHPEVHTEDRTIDSDGRSIAIRIYRPTRQSGPAPVVMFLHGGGFAVGDLDTYDGTARQHAVGADAIVVAVDYRLAPEHPYPAAVQDVWAATRWVAEHAEDLGADSSRMAVAGDSAGGCLAAAVAHLARDNGGPALIFQLLWYPSLMWDLSLPSFTENAEAPILDTKAVLGFSQWYAGEADLADPPDTLAPGRAANLSNLPSTYIAVAGHDPLRDDGFAYAGLLSASGTAVAVDHAETLMHGYLGFAGVVPVATEAMDRGLSALRAALHT